MTKATMLENCLSQMKDIFKQVTQNATKLDTSVEKYFEKMSASNIEEWRNVRLEFSKCSCGKLMQLKGGKDDYNKDKRALWCRECKVSHWLPTANTFVIEIATSANNEPIFCPICNFQALHATSKSDNSRKCTFETDM